jgi:hypothetical protein
MKKVLAYISVLFLIAAVLSGYIWIKRIGLPYNEQGMYFDDINEVVYHQQSALVYGLIGLSMACASIIIIGGHAHAFGGYLTPEN